MHVADSEGATGTGKVFGVAVGTLIGTKPQDLLQKKGDLHENNVMPDLTLAGVKPTVSRKPLIVPSTSLNRACDHPICEHSI